MAQGMGGFMSLTEWRMASPRAGVPVSYIFTGVYSVVGIRAAPATQRTGKGCYVDTAWSIPPSACWPTRA